MARGGEVPSTKRLRFHHHLSRTSPEGKHAVGIGLAVGWWPCYRSPFIKAEIGKHKIAMWYGGPCYRKDLAK